MLTNSIKDEKDRICQKLKEAKAEMRKMPSGRLECHSRNDVSNGNYYRWFIVKDGIRTSLPKTEIELAKKLAYKRKLKQIIASYENQLIALDTYLSITSGQVSKHINETTKAQIRKNRDSKHNKVNNEIDRLAALYISSKNKELYEWANADYQDHGHYPEGLTIRSKTGRMVRSRIEAEIDRTLAEHGLYYRYEDSIILNGKHVHPDFTIIHPITKQIIIWEHLGRLDSEKYRTETIKKIWLYINNGFYPNINLIFTSEAQEFTLDYQLLDEIVDVFLT